MEIVTEIKPFLFKMLREVGINPTDEQIKIIDRGKPHSLKFIDGKMYVYTFRLQDEYLKIGKAGRSSKARFYSHHYNPESSKSNLARSILSDTEMNLHSLSKVTMGDWIKNNIDRVDIEVDEGLGIFTLNLIESILHCMYLPKYEGFKSQRST